MALNDKKISTAPGTRPNPQQETVYSPSRGGHYPAEPKPTPGAGNGTNGRLKGNS
ncbi:hypothetical protein J7I97_25045 [Streptomyces sp. ISL-87]|uniref:hypothetical protein n=1 Tax=Streptomyces sp. ISL-87 TaxID=2819188 RepID=UPI001BEC3A38|nr:hypothetical protein [Streptomyces sp. ISL-87]MBT2611435.1 hypothetical protein [Streptomyces sp. ISL-87]